MAVGEQGGYVRPSFLVSLLVAMFAGCASQDAARKAIPNSAAPSVIAQPPANRTPSIATTPPQVKRAPVPEMRPDPLDDPKSPLAKRSVYFDFDTPMIKAAFRPVIEAHARYLGANRGAQVRLEGNTDERGGREYNLALGTRRGDAVRSALKVLGATDGQIEVVSFGEEKPRTPDHDEAAWAENRRVDIVYMHRK